MTREPIYAALFATLSTAAPFVASSRRLRHWSDVGPAEQPSLFVVQKSETVQRRKGLPPKWTLAVDLFVYARAPDEVTSAATVLNPLIDAIESALAPPSPTATQTLGGLVEHAWIAGKVETDEGVLGGQAVAIVPIEILVPA
jgi:hypothetical protein